MKAGFISILGKPNAGKSSLLNAIMGEKLAIVSPKVQTTRHRIKAILTEPNYQLIFSDTPGIIDPKYKLHQKMMNAVQQSIEDADVLLLIVDVTDIDEKIIEVFDAIKTKSPTILVVNKIDLIQNKEKSKLYDELIKKPYAQNLIEISAVENKNVDGLIKKIVDLLPEGEPFFDGDDLSDLPTKFFVSELIREKIYHLYEDELPYQATVLVQEFKEKSTLIKIRADIIVQRESQKAIIIGNKGEKIKKLGTEARLDIEKFLQSKVFLELFVKVRNNWRDNETFLKEYGYF